MSKTIQLWLEYFGIDKTMLFMILAIIAITQLWKMLLKAFNGLNADRVRPMPYLAGSFMGLVYVSFTSAGALTGVAAGMISSLGYYGFTAYLERENAPAWQKKLASRMAMK